MKVTFLGYSKEIQINFGSDIGGGGGGGWGLFDFYGYEMLCDVGGRMVCGGGGGGVFWKVRKESKIVQRHWQEGAFVKKYIYLHT